MIELVEQNKDKLKGAWNEYFTKEELSAILKKIYHRFYFRPSYILQSIANISNFTDLINKIKGVGTLLK